MNEPPARQSALGVSFLALAGCCGLLIVSATQIAAQEALRSAAVDPAAAGIPAGRKSIDRSVYEKYVAATAAGKPGTNAGGIERCHYKLTALPDGSLSGEVTGKFNLVGAPAIISLGRPSFAMNNLVIDGQQAIWGTDSLGGTCLLCPRDDAEFRFECSQQGVRRGESIEFSFDWLTSVATHLELKVPARVQLETPGLLKTGENRENDGGRILIYEAGARPSSTIRIVQVGDSPRQRIGMDLHQTVSASSTKVLIQSVVRILCQTPGVEFAEVELPKGFTLLRATLGGSERLPLNGQDRRGGVLKVPLGEVETGQRIELRLIMERPADWSQPLRVPRVAPRNGILLREEWTVQIEKPLELMSVDAPAFVQTSLSVEAAREMWTYEGTSADGHLTLTARTPQPVWSADCYVRRQLEGPRAEIRTLIDLKAHRAPLFEFDVDLVKPWKVVSITAPDTTGAPAALSFTLLQEFDESLKYRVLLRSPATPQRNAVVTIAAASQSAGDPFSELRPVAIPQGGALETFVISSARAGEAGHQNSEPGPAVALSALRTGLRANAFFENIKPETTSIRRLDPGPAGEDSLASNRNLDDSARADRDDRRQPIPFADGVAVVELRSVLGAAAGSSSHLATFLFADPVEVSGAAFHFESEWTLIDVECDGVSLNALSLPRELRLPQFSQGVREIQIRYSVPGGLESTPRRDEVPWPQVTASVQRWIWRIESPPDRRMTDIDAPAEFAGGLSRPALRERLLAPLGRAAGEAIFNPFQVGAWRNLSGLMSPGAAPNAGESSKFVAAGRAYPRATSIVSWSSRRLEWLSWVLFLGSMLGVSALRRFRRHTFRFAGVLAAFAASCAWLLPAPFGSMAGAVFCGSLLAFVLPRRILSQFQQLPLAAPGSSRVRLAGASAVILAFTAAMTAAIVESQDQTPNVPVIDANDTLEATVVVSEDVAREVAAWQRDQNDPAFLIRDAHYDVQVDESDLAAVKLVFDVVVPRPQATRSVQLPFEGLTFRAHDAALINGEPVRLVPTANGGGVILALPAEVASDDRGPASFRIDLTAALRVPNGSMKREFAFAAPRCTSAIGVVRSAGTLGEFRSTARGRTQSDNNVATCALGGASRWQARWRSGEEGSRAVAEVPVTARAESVISAEPESLRASTRLVVETPELPDPFASTRLEIRLPAHAIVASVSGETLVHWRTRPETNGLYLLLDLIGPPIVGQQFDFQYDLPTAAIRALEIPSIPLLPPSRLSSHQIAVVTTPAFEAEILSRPDIEAGLWEIEPSEASFSLRKDRGFPVPASAIELERPAPLALDLKRRATGRTAELEQSLTASSNSISWSGTARIETSSRPGFLYKFQVDPAIEIQSASVTERDVERLSRFVRDGESLLLVVGDDRLGTKQVRLEGKLRLEPGKVRRVPRFELQNTVVTRREIVVTSTVDQLLQVRRNEASSLLVGRKDLEWEPTTPSSRRVALSTDNPPLVMRWINPASPLKLVEFLKLPDTGDSSCLIEWSLESTRQLPATLAIDAPRGTQIADSSDFAEENRRPLPGDRVRIELQARSSRAVESRIRMTVPMQTAAEGAGVLPRVADLAVQPVTYLAVPRAILPDYEIPGDFLDQLPPGTPEEWSTLFRTRQLLVFRFTGSSWRVVKVKNHESFGTATLERIASESTTHLHGQSRWIISPSRVGLLEIKPPLNGAFHAVHCSPGALVERVEEGSWLLLLRPSQPVAVYADWSIPRELAAGGDVGAIGPQVPGLEVQAGYVARVPSPASSEWKPEILARPAGADLLAAARLENLLQAARLLPIGVRPPAWLRDELLDLGRSFRNSPQTEQLAVQVEGLLDSWSARMSTLTAPNSVAPDAALLTRDTERMLAEGMLVAGADPDAVVEVPRGRSGWSISRRVFNAAFVTAWIVFWAFIITKGGQWARQQALADRVARRPGAVMIAIGIAWWLLLSPSGFGAALALAALFWEVSSLIRQQRLRLASPSRGSTS